MALEQSTLSVLLVEDNPGDAKLVERYLDTGVTDQYIDELTFTHVETLTAALDRLDADHFDVLLLDLGLPKSTGLDTVDRIMDADVRVPIIVLTGLDDSDTAIEAIKRGAQDYLSKDKLDSDRLIRAMRYAIERYEQEQALQRQTEQMAFFNQILRHDMLNGMNVILARGEMLEANLDGDEQAYAETIVEWSDNIIDLTDKIRNVLETLTEDTEHELHAVNVDTVAQVAAERARSMGGTVDVDVPDGLAVRADSLLEDVLSNLTTNAVEHGGDDVEIELSASHEGNRIAVCVADDGPGIPEDDRQQLFERGHKGSSSTGSGFGLYFVASMADAYDGEVTVEESDAGGAAFCLTLPAARQFEDA